MALPLIVGDTNTEVPTRQWYGGPALSSAEAVYGLFTQFDVADTGHENVVAVLKSSDPDSVSFTEQDRANAPLHSNIATKTGGKTIWAVQRADIIHIGWYEDAGATTYKYATFNMATDLWGSVLTIEVMAAALPLAQSISIEVRDDGDVIALYNGNTESLKGTPFERVYHARKENGTFAVVGVLVSGAGEDDWTGSVIVKGPNDRMHFFFKNDDLNDLYQRTLNSANSLESLPAAGDAEVHARAHLIGRGINNAGNIRCPYHDGPPNANEGQVSFAEFASSDTPGAFTVNPDVGDFVVRALKAPCMALDGTDEHMLYSRNSDNDLFHDVNGGTDIEEIAANIQGISCEVYERKGTKVLALFYDNGGTPTYDEIVLAAPPVAGGLGLAALDSLDGLDDID